MSKLFTLEIHTPDRLFFKGEVESLTVDTLTGRRGFLAGAAAAVYVLRSGVIKILHNQKWAEALNTDGFLSVSRDGVTILAPVCLWPHETKEETDGETTAGGGQTSREYQAVKRSLQEKLIRE